MKSFLAAYVVSTATALVGRPLTKLSLSLFCACVVELVVRSRRELDDFAVNASVVAIVVVAAIVAVAVVVVIALVNDNDDDLG